MYRPAHFCEDRPEVLAQFIEAHPLGALVATTAAGLLANHVPMQLAHGKDGRRSLRGHIARANELRQSVADGAAVLVLFGGPQHYVSPGWYPSKRATGEVVPTWNYQVVHAHGTIRFIDDPVWLRALVAGLTEQHERGRDPPWAIGDAPPRYLEGMLRAIVGFEIGIERLEGKFKASQNRDPADRAGVATGLAADGLAPADVANLVRVD
jgi:transcriptional regulator